MKTNIKNSIPFLIFILIMVFTAIPGISKAQNCDRVIDDTFTNGDYQRSTPDNIESNATVESSASLDLIAGGTITWTDGFHAKDGSSAKARTNSADCNGEATISDDRDDPQNPKIYNTVQIGCQCWMKENLDVGTRIDAPTDQSDNPGANFIEKYCYDNDPDNCTQYGGLYQWDEMMGYNPSDGCKDQRSQTASGDRRSASWTRGLPLGQSSDTGEHAYLFARGSVRGGGRPR